MKKFNLSVIFVGLALTVLAGAATAAEVPSDGLVAYYACSGNFDNSASTTLPQAVNYGASFAADRFGNANSACYFDGNESYIEVPDDDAFSIATTGALTVSAWMSPEVLNFKNNEDGCYVHWMGKGMPSQHEWAFRMYNNYLDTCKAAEDRNRHNRISAYAFSLGGGWGSGSYVQESVTAGEWIHIVARYDMKTNWIYIFKNGVAKDHDQLNESEYNVVQENGTAPFRMGTRSTWSFFQGRIDDVRIYNRALSDEEILALYNEAAPGSSSSSATPSSSSNPESSSSSSAISSSGSEIGSSSSISSSNSGERTKILPLGKALLSPENREGGAIYRANGQTAPEGLSPRNRAKGTYYKKIKQ